MKNSARKLSNVMESSNKPRRRIIFSQLTAVILSLAAVAIFAIIASGHGRTEHTSMRIACGNDAAGMIISYAAEKSGGVEIRKETGHSVSFLRLADCCGTQAEFAFAAGEFDIAVLCPDAAEKFLESGREFVIAGGIIRNTNVLVSKTDVEPAIIGYTSGRTMQAEAAKARFGDEIELVPAKSTALPYALEVGAVDAIVLDILTAMKYCDGLILTPLPHDRATSVMAVRKDLIGTQPYNDFLRAYNESVTMMNDEMLAGILEDIEKFSNSAEKVLIWKTMGITLISVPNGE